MGSCCGPVFSSVSRVATSSAVRSLKSVLPTDFPSLGIPWLIEAATALYGRARVADRIPQVANVVISNVPGPPVPLYMAGARMLTNYPASIIVHGLALNITVQSYNGRLDYGLIACRRAVPDVNDLADGNGVQQSIGVGDAREGPRARQGVFELRAEIAQEGRADGDAPATVFFLQGFRQARRAAGQDRDVRHEPRHHERGLLRRAEGDAQARSSCLFWPAVRLAATQLPQSG